MIDEVRPALDAEQWRDLSVDGDDCVALHNKSDEWYSEGLYFAGMGTSPYYMRHAVAALALHGQPFGFTWEDVKELRDWGTEYDGIDPAAGALIMSIAARIAALLPSEDV